MSAAQADFQLSENVCAAVFCRVTIVFPHIDMRYNGRRIESTAHGDERIDILVFCCKIEPAGRNSGRARLKTVKNCAVVSLSLRSIFAGECKAAYEKRSM